MSKQGRIHSIDTFGVLDGPGIRYLIYFQGCPLRCKFCHNRDSWDTINGTEMSVEEIVIDVQKYIPFINASGGGVTVGGGEPLLQLDFLTRLMKALKEIGIHTCIDTSGFIAPRLTDELLKYIDLVLLDIKQMDGIKHRDLTGVANDKILAFARHLSAKGIEIWIRYVLVPTINDSKQDIVQLAKFVNTLKTAKKIEFLPYHTKGKFKWTELNYSYPLEGVPEATELDVERAEKILKEHFSPECGS